MKIHYILAVFEVANIKKRGGLTNKKLSDQRDGKSDVVKRVRLLKSCFIYALFKRKS